MRSNILMLWLLVAFAGTAALAQTTADDYYNSGNERKKSGDTDGAISDYTKAIEINPGAVKAYINRAALLGGRGDYDGAIADSGRAIELDPGMYEAYFGRAAGYLFKGNLNEAISDAGKAIEIDPGKAEVYHIRGLAKYRSRDFAGALHDFSRCIDLGMPTATVYMHRGIARDALDDFLGGILDTTRAIELDPKYVKAYAARAIARRSYGDYLGAIADYNKVLEFQPGDQNSVIGRAWSRLFMDDGAGAARDAAQYLDLNGANATADGDGPFAVAIIYIGHRKAGKPVTAKAFIERSLQKARTTDWTTQLLRFLGGQLTEKQLLEQAKDDNDKQTDAHSFIGVRSLLDGDRKNAAVHFKWDKEHGSHSRIAHQLARVEYARM